MLDTLSRDDAFVLLLSAPDGERTRIVRAEQLARSVLIARRLQAVAFLGEDTSAEQNDQEQKIKTTSDVEREDGDNA